ncbi:MAG: cyclic nucleotide-binding domain-containing protein [bacterium]|nr:cyclic nucleotide-binding domain-containing protein [bacterium]
MGNQNEFVLSILKGLDMFADINYKALRGLSSLFEERIYNQNEVIFNEGDIGNSMMVITSGEVRISQTPDSNNTEETLIILKEGDVFGEMALIDDLPRSASTISHTNVIIFEISRSNFLNYVKNDSENGIKILLRLAKVLSARLRETDNKLKAFINLSQWI